MQSTNPVFSKTPPGDIHSIYAYVSVSSFLNFVKAQTIVRLAKVFAKPPRVWPCDLFVLLFVCPCELGTVAGESAGEGIVVCGRNTLRLFPAGLAIYCPTLLPKEKHSAQIMCQRFQIP